MLLPLVAGAQIPTGGTVLFTESFDDNNFGDRGWYNCGGGECNGKGTINNSVFVAGGGAFECNWCSGGGCRSCTGDRPSRMAFTATETIYVSFWMKTSADWIGADPDEFHPHIFQVMSDLDASAGSNAANFLNTYIEFTDGYPLIALQDALNVWDDCIQRPGSPSPPSIGVVRNAANQFGCPTPGPNSTEGEAKISFDAFWLNAGSATSNDDNPDLEDRSVATCNAILGRYEGTRPFDPGEDFVDCYIDGIWVSQRQWYATTQAFASAAPYDKTDWHFIEVYMEMNTISGGIGQTDGKIRYLFDGEVLITSDDILFRTNTNATLKWDKFIISPFIGSGSGADQELFWDELTVATAKPDGSLTGGSLTGGSLQ